MANFTGERTTRLFNKLKAFARQTPVGKRDWFENLTGLLPDQNRFRPKLKISRKQLQERLEKSFPIEKPFWQRFLVRLHTPRLLLMPTSNRLTIGCEVCVEMASPESAAELVSGAIDLSSGITYKPELGCFYLSHPAIHAMRIKGLPSPVMNRCKDVVNTLVMSKLNELPIYELNATERKHLALKKVLKDITIGQEEITLYFGINGDKQP